MSTPAVLTLDLAELVLIYALRTFDPAAYHGTKAWQLSPSPILNTLGPRASFPLITTAAVYRCLTHSDSSLDFAFTRGDPGLLDLTLRIWRRKPDWKIPARAFAYGWPDVLVGAVRASRGDVIAEWLALAADGRVPVQKRMVGNAIRACVRLGEWRVLSELMRHGPRFAPRLQQQQQRFRFSVAWMWKCASQSALVYNPSDMDAAVRVMDTVREMHRRLYTADRERMAAEVAAIGEDEAQRKAYAYNGQPSWRVMVDSLRFMQGLLASALRCKEPERMLMWWFRFDDELKAWDEERVREEVVGKCKREGVDAVVRWWYTTHKVRRKPRWTPAERKEYWYASWW